MNEKDRRVKRTKKLLKSTLAELLLEKNLRNITVRELAEKAVISRGAFYTHYDDIYDLSQQMENDVFEEFGAIFQFDPGHTYEETFMSLIDYVYDNPAICQIFMGKGSESSFRDKLANLMEEKVSEIVLYEMEATESKDDWDYLNRYTCYGTVSALSMGIDSKFSYQMEKLFKMIMDIDDRVDCLYE